MVVSWVILTQNSRICGSSEIAGTRCIVSEIIDQGLKPTGADPNLIKKQPQQKEKKQKKARRGKITNTHMKGILKDYSQLV